MGGMNVTKDTTALDQRHFNSDNHMYSIQSNSWTKLNNLPKKTAYHAIVSHKDIYCGGGYHAQSEASSNLYAYDIHGKLWLRKANMNSGRFSFCLEAMHDSVCACGGFSRSNTTINNIEVYSIFYDQWTILHDITLKHPESPSTVVCNGDIYIVGGGSKDHHCIPRIQSVALTFQATRSQVSKLPLSFSRHRCAVLTVPRT